MATRHCFWGAGDRENASGCPLRTRSDPAEPRGAVVTAATLVAMLGKGHDDGLLEKHLTQLSRPKLLIIDELGYLPFEANAAHLSSNRYRAVTRKGQS